MKYLSAFIVALALACLVSTGARTDVVHGSATDAVATAPVVGRASSFDVADGSDGSERLDVAEDVADDEFDRDPDASAGASAHPATSTRASRNCAAASPRLPGRRASTTEILASTHPVRGPPTRG